MKTNLWDWARFAGGDAAAGSAGAAVAQQAGSAAAAQAQQADGGSSAADAKPTDTKPTDVKAEPSLLNQDVEKKTDDAKPAEVPEKYEFKAPEGQELNKAAIEAATPIFKELKLSQDQAQKLVDLYSTQTKSLLDGQMTAWKETQDKWVAQIKSDPEIGGKMDQVRTTVAKALDLLPADVSKQFREAMDFTGAGNHPAFVKALYLWGQKLTEGGAVQGSPGSAKRPASAGAALYPSLPSAG